MITKHIKITYIDDKIDPLLSNYLTKYVEKSNIKVLKYDEIKFEEEFDYDSLINHDKFKNSDIVIIDSKLYENDNTRGNNYTGEVFELLLRDRSPYVEVIVVTQNYVSENSATLKKAVGWDTHEKYYKDNLKPLLDHFVKRVVEHKNKIKEEINKKNLDKASLERIEDLLNHNDSYRLTSKDIDEIIRHFNNISKE